MDGPVEVLPPNVQLFEKTASTFDPGAAFISSVAITRDGKPATESTATTETASDAYFAFNDAAFVDLQSYLVAALRLPPNKEKYELLYSRDIFEKRLAAKNQKPLYDETLSVITTIHKNCLDFKTNTFNTLITTAGTISNFSETANIQSKIARDALPVITAPGMTLSDKAVEAALGNFTDAISIMKKQANKSAAECKTQSVAIGAFKDQVATDKSALEKVKRQNETYLPSVDDLNTENKAAMARAYEKLNEICKVQNKKYDQLKPFVTILKWIPFLGVRVMFSDLSRELEAVNGIRQATAEYEKIFNETNTEMQSTIRFRGQTKNLMRSMEEVLATISKAEAALAQMTGWFSKFGTDLDAVESILDTALEHASDNKWAFKRTKAAGDLDQAGAKWLKILDLASRFQARGMIACTEIDKDTDKELSQAEKMMDIISTNYGGNDVTKFSQVLFRFGEQIRIRSIEPGFPDPWDRVVKTISMIHSFEEKDRLYICKEFTNFHILAPGPIKDYQGSPRIALQLDPAKTRCDGAEIHVLAVTYGPEDVTFKKQKNSDRTVLDYVYACKASDSPVEFNNDKMGGDTWNGFPKSGTVFYRPANGKDVYQVTGREGDSIGWTQKRS